MGPTVLLFLSSLSFFIIVWAEKPRCFYYNNNILIVFIHPVFICSFNEDKEYWWMDFMA